MAGYWACDDDGNKIWVEKKKRNFSDDLDGPGSSSSGLKGYNSSMNPWKNEAPASTSTPPLALFASTPTPSLPTAPSAATGNNGGVATDKWWRASSSAQTTPVSAPPPPPKADPAPAFSLPTAAPSVSVPPPPPQAVPAPALPLPMASAAPMANNSLGLGQVAALPPLYPPAAGPLGFHPIPGSLRPIAACHPHAGSRLPIGVVDNGEVMVNQLLNWPDFELFVGLFFQESGTTPAQIAGRREHLGHLGLRDWERDWRKFDEINKGNYVDRWQLPPDPRQIQRVAAQVLDTSKPEMSVAFAEAVRRWARKDGANMETSRVQFVLERAMWCQPWGTACWIKMRDIKSMPDGPAKDQVLAQAKAESPLWFARCWNDYSCGGYKITKKRKPPYPAHLPDDEAYWVTHGAEGRRETYDSDHDKKYVEDQEKEYLAKRRMMTFGGGKPTQIHAVPYEERALDSRGKKLPWAHEWPEGHPNARGQRRHAEEKGAFGKSSARKASSRATRTATPAKKDNPALDGFEQAWKFDQKKAAEAQQQSNATRTQGDGTSIHRPPSHNKEPTQVYLYGFSSSTQWAAISFYETVSGGMICEDYERQPPVELRRIPNAYSSPVSVRSRALTTAEKTLANRYHGGNHWIKVTFDSAEAAERAMYHSPHRIQGHWVYAREFRGVGPDVDEPILTRRDDAGSGSLSASSRPSQTLGPSFGQRSNTESRGATTLPRSFTTSAMPQAPEATEVASHSSSTASSATATGPNYPNLRNRHPSQAEENRSSINSQQDGQATSRPKGFKHFPDIPRTVLRPASEAFLPHPTWSESMLQRLVNAGWIPGDFIGTGAPRLENGDFDYANASYYWRFFHWVDSVLGTDLCGMQDQ